MIELKFSHVSCVVFIAEWKFTNVSDLWVCPFRPARQHFWDFFIFLFLFFLGGGYETKAKIAGSIGIPPRCVLTTFSHRGMNVCLICAASLSHHTVYGKFSLVPITMYMYFTGWPEEKKLICIYYFFNYFFKFIYLCFKYKKILFVFAVLYIL